MSDLHASESAVFLTVRGKGTSPGLACGPLCRNRQDLTAREAEGTILVAERAVPDDVGRILASAGTLTLSGALLSHVSLLSREFGKPSVSLGLSSRARIVPEADGGLLELADVVGGDSRILSEGDVVLVNGDEGLLRIPGGLDRSGRLAARGVHSPLAAYAESPDDRDLLGAVVNAAGRPDGPAFAYLIEAALPYRLVPPGEPARKLIEALSSDAGRRRVLDHRLASMAARILERASRRCERTTETIAATRDIDELARMMRELEACHSNDLALLEDLQVDPGPLTPRMEASLAAAAVRREELSARLCEQISTALLMPESAFRHRLGSLFRLLRLARGLRMEGGGVPALQARLTRELARERARAGTHLVIPLDDEKPHARALVGGKAAGLLDVRAVLPAGCRIPRGFVVTASAYRLHLLGETGERLKAAVEEGGDDASVSRRARAALLASEIPEEVERAIAGALSALRGSRLAVRSSATLEDSPAGSLAGLFDTYLGIRGLDELLERIRRAWASLWNARALRALAAAGLSPLGASQAVLVQEVIETRAAGVLFSRDPSGRPDTLLVNANWGLGEGISQGEVPGDLYWVRRSTGEILATESAPSSTRIVLDGSGVGTVEVPLLPEQAGLPCLSAEDLGRLAALAQALEESTGRVQDVEFGFSEAGELLVFQVRRVVPRWRD